MLFVALGTWIALLAPPLSDPRFLAAMSLLSEAQIGSDTASLIRYLQKQTPDPGRLERIGALIRQLGDPRFVVRNKASEELTAIGDPAEKALEAALSDPDAERAERAERHLKALRENPDTPIILAALFLMSYSNSRDAVESIFNYLPFIHEPCILDAAKETLLHLGMKEGKAIPAAASWAFDKESVRRSIAGYLLGRSSDPKQQKVARQLVRDSDPWVRLRTAEGMLYAGKETAVPILIELLDPKTSDRSWAALRLLATLFGRAFPDAPSSDRADEWSRYRESCLEWWLQTEAGITVEKLPRSGRPLGLVIGVEFNPGNVWGCGLDGHQLWQVHVHHALDARWLPDGKVLIVAADPNRVIECERSGKIIWERFLPDRPIACDRLTNGNTYIGLTSSVMEMHRNGSIVSQHQFPLPFTTAGRRLPNGHYIGINNLGQIAELDRKGNLVLKIQAPNGTDFTDISWNRKGNFVLLKNRGILEIDRKGKVVAELGAEQANYPLTGLDVLPDNNLLVGGNGKCIILGWDGKVRWEAKGVTHQCTEAHIR